ncbi:MAG: HAD hydrolase-like protein [Halobacteria archaeon]|nr:HAD hydrolase-like protein [Halobacteria archaeon]
MYEAVVYDLDGTLILLDVDWDRVRHEISELLSEKGLETSPSVWEMYATAHEEGIDEVEKIIRRHEVEGARFSERLETADEVEDGIPTGVCSLNSERACRVGIERHGLDSKIDTVVGRDTEDVDGWKPDPEPLLEAVERLSVDPDDAVFVGNSERDRVTAEKADVEFRKV